MSAYSARFNTNVNHNLQESTKKELLRSFSADFLFEGDWYADLYVLISRVDGVIWE